MTANRCAWVNCLTIQPAIPTNFTRPAREPDCNPQERTSNSKDVVDRYGTSEVREASADHPPGFKKGVGRATTQVMMKTGQIERTNDRDFETELRRYRTMETAANKLQKEAKGYLDSLRGNDPSYLCAARKVGLTTLVAMTASQLRIAETIDAFYGDAGTKDGVSRSYKQAVTDLDAETIKALDGPYRYDIPSPTDNGVFLHTQQGTNICITERPS